MEARKTPQTKQRKELRSDFPLRSLPGRRYRLPPGCGRRSRLPGAQGAPPAALSHPEPRPPRPQAGAAGRRLGRCRRHRKRPHPLRRPAPQDPGRRLPRAPLHRNRPHRRLPLHRPGRDRRPRSNRPPPVRSRHLPQARGTNLPKPRVAPPPRRHRGRLLGLRCRRAWLLASRLHARARHPFPRRPSPRQSLRRPLAGVLRRRHDRRADHRARPHPQSSRRLPHLRHGRQGLPPLTPRHRPAARRRRHRRGLHRSAPATASASPPN